MLSAETHWGNGEASGEESYGRFLYNFFRDDDPATGRYLEADPIGQAAALNIYAYAGANPTNATDPSGQFLVIVAGIVVGGALGAPLVISALQGDPCAFRRTQEALAVGLLIPTALLGAAAAAIEFPNAVAAVIATSPTTAPTVQPWLRPDFAPQGFFGQLSRGVAGGLRNVPPAYPGWFEERSNSLAREAGNLVGEALQRAEENDPCRCGVAGR